MVMYQAVTTPGANPGAEGTAGLVTGLGLVLTLAARKRK